MTSQSRIPRLAFSSPVFPLPNAATAYFRPKPLPSRIPVLDRSADAYASTSSDSSFQYHRAFSWIGGPPSRIPILVAEMDVDLELVRLTACEQRPLSEQQKLHDADRELCLTRKSAPIDSGRSLEFAFDTDNDRFETTLPPDPNSASRRLGSNIPVPIQNTSFAWTASTSSIKSASPDQRDETSSKPSRIPLRAAGLPAADSLTGVAAPASLPATTPRSARESEAEVVVDFNFYPQAAATTTGSDSRRLSITHSHSYSSGCPGSPAATTTSALAPDTGTDSDPLVADGPVYFECRKGRQHHDSIGSVSTLSLISSDEEDDEEAQKVRRPPKHEAARAKETAAASGGGPPDGRSRRLEDSLCQPALQDTNASHSRSSEAPLVVATQRGHSHNGAAGVTHGSQPPNKELGPASSQARHPSSSPQSIAAQLKTAATSLEVVHSAQTQSTRDKQTQHNNTAEKSAVSKHQQPLTERNQEITDQITAPAPAPKVRPQGAKKKREEQFAMEISCSPPCLYTAKPFSPTPPPKPSRASESRASAPRHELHTCQVRQVELRLCPRPLASPGRQRGRRSANGGRLLTRELATGTKRATDAHHQENTVAERAKKASPAAPNKSLSNAPAVSNDKEASHNESTLNGETKKFTNGIAGTSRVQSVGNLHISSLANQNESVVTNSIPPASAIPVLINGSSHVSGHTDAARGIYKATSTQRITNLTAYLSSQTASSKQKEPLQNSSNGIKGPERIADAPVLRPAIRDSIKSKSTLQLNVPSQKISPLNQAPTGSENGLQPKIISRTTLPQPPEAVVPLRQSPAELRKSFNNLLDTLGRSPSTTEPKSSSPSISTCPQVPDRSAIDSAFQYLSAQAYVAGEHRQMLREYASFARIMQRVYGSQLTQTALRPCPGSPRPCSPQSSIAGTTRNLLTGTENEVSATATATRPQSPQMVDQKKSPLTGPKASLCLKQHAAETTAPVRLRAALVPVRASKIFGERVPRMQLQLARPASIFAPINGASDAETAHQLTNSTHNAIIDTNV